jgi:hypothetical protein
MLQHANMSWVLLYATAAMFLSHDDHPWCRITAIILNYTTMWQDIIEVDAVFPTGSFQQ